VTDPDVFCGSRFQSAVVERPSAIAHAAVTHQAMPPVCMLDTFGCMITTPLDDVAFTTVFGTGWRASVRHGKGQFHPCPAAFKFHAHNVHILRTQNLKGPLQKPE